MITDLETLLNSNQLKELVKAINNNTPYEFEQDGLTVKANSGDNYVNLLIAYNEDKKEENLAKKEAAKFRDFLNELDDDIFTETCEELDNLQEINECLNSSKLETVRAGIMKFKNALSAVATRKINKLVNYVRSNSANQNSSCKCKC